MKRFIVLFQPSKRIHSGFYMTDLKKIQFKNLTFQPSKRIHSGFYTRQS